MQKWTVLIDNGFSKYSPSPCSYVYHGCMMVSHAMLPESSMVMHIQQRLPPFAFMQDFAGHPECYNNIIDGERHKVFANLH